MATNGDLARVLLRKAGGDEAVIRKIGPDTDIADEIVGFHAQQAVEKAMKAVLAFKGIKFPFVHDLEILRDLCDVSGIKLPSTLNSVEDLTPFAAAERYGSETPQALDRDQALKWAAATIAWARGIVE